MFRTIQVGSSVTKTGTVLLLLLAAAWQACAQAPPEVEAAFLKYADATRTYDTEIMSGLMHPLALSRIRATIDTALRGPKKDIAEKELLPLFSVGSYAEFAQLTDVDAYKRMNDMVRKSAPEIVGLMSNATYEVVGTFMKEDIAYLNYKLTIKVEGKEIGTQVVQTLKQHDGHWLLLLPSTAEASMAGIEKRFNPTSESP